MSARPITRAAKRSSELSAEIHAPGAIAIHLQPIVEVCGGRRRLHGVECLARGPRGTELEQAAKLFERVRRDGIEADVERCRELAEGSPSIVTPLNRWIGYEAAAAVAKQSIKERRSIREVVLERGHVESGELTEQQLDEALDVLGMTRPGG